MRASLFLTLEIVSLYGFSGSYNEKEEDEILLEVTSNHKVEEDNYAKDRANECEKMMSRVPRPYALSNSISQ